MPSNAYDDLRRAAAEIACQDPRVEAVIDGDPEHLDPIAAAERLTGEKCEKFDDAPSKLALAIHLAKQGRLSEMATAEHDSTYACSALEYWGILDSIGYRCVLDTEYMTTQKLNIDGVDDPYVRKIPHARVLPETAKKLSPQGNLLSADVLIPEQLRVYWNDGLLLVATTYQGTINSAQICFNIKTPDGRWPKLSFTGGAEYDDYPGNWRKEVKEADIDRTRLTYVGYIDSREFVRRQTKRVRESGEVLGIWKHYVDSLAFMQPWWIERDSSKGHYQPMLPSWLTRLPEDILVMIKQA